MSDEIAVESGVSMPLSRPGGRKRKYPWLSMDIGDSFVMAPKRRNTAYQMASLSGLRHGRKFAVRSQPDGTVRIWRTA